ncbi:Tyrosine-protein phosphatase non-receptor type 18 [Labeo rohita]|uniref:protein-tyrosine-phosphatase n=1 Tax=Labeo rohita TaxID=84645 RepID=A0ABQ8MGC0_LABRO|nr:Tyrosine-protein phosphatase non-receptor type 18 [Labeo rohita]
MVMEAHLLRFVERVRCLSDHDSGGDQLISTEFNLIRQTSASLKEDYGLTTATGEIKENVKKNRYRDILPYDQTRVCLAPTTSEYESDYINANFIKGAAKNKMYIATQGPLSSTVVDFWRMIWQHNVKVIIMACREFEMGKKKCEVYWVSTTDTSNFGPFTVSTAEESQPNEEVIVRTLVVKYCDETRKVSHFQYTAWPDHGIPDMADGILGMMELARQKQGNQTDPVVIHCSAGCGRTGVICAVDYVNDLLLTETSASLYINAVPPRASQKSGTLGSISVPPKTRNQPLKSRLSHPLPQIRMNDTYAVINKSKQPPLSAPHSITVHHYDNADLEKSNNNAVYSTVKPKTRPMSVLPSPTSLGYDRSTTANQRGGLAPKKMDNEGYELLPGELRSMNRDLQPHSSLSRSPSATESQSSTDDDYEYVSSVVKDTSSPFAPGSLGFNCRIKKPKGPRDPPAEWSRAER